MKLREFGRRVAGSLYSLHISSICGEKGAFLFSENASVKSFPWPFLYISSCSFLKLMTDDVRLKMCVYKDQKKEGGKFLEIFRLHWIVWKALSNGEGPAVKRKGICFFRVGGEGTCWCRLGVVWEAQAESSHILK